METVLSRSVPRTSRSPPAAQANLLPSYDSGDGLHLNPAGYQPIANAINLSLFSP